MSGSQALHRCGRRPVMSRSAPWCPMSRLTPAGAKGPHQPTYIPSGSSRETQRLPKPRARLTRHCTSRNSSRSLPVTPGCHNATHQVVPPATGPRKVIVVSKALVSCRYPANQSRRASLNHQYAKPPFADLYGEIRFTRINSKTDNRTLTVRTRKPCRSAIHARPAPSVPHVPAGRPL